MQPTPPLRLQRQLPRLPRSAPAAPRDGRGTGKGRVQRRRGRGVPSRGHGILRLPGYPARGLGVKTRGSQLGRPCRSPCTQQRRLRSRGGAATATPPPDRRLGRGCGGGVQVLSLVRSRAVPPTDSTGSLPEARQQVIVTTRGFPGQRWWGGAQSTWPRLLLAGGLPRPLFLDL